MTACMKYSFAEVLTVAKRQPCPVCAAEPGQPCDVNGYHWRRVLAANAAIQKICASEGHHPHNVTTFDTPHREYLCGRCGHTWNEPLPDDTPAPGPEDR